MNTRPTRPTAAASNQPRRRTRRAPSFTLHPLGLAALVALGGPAFAGPTGGQVVAGQATLTAPSATLQVVNQSTDKAIIDWRSFSIGANETVRFVQPTSTSVTLNRVNGYDPSYIFGQLQANGRVFLLNPNGVVFGAGARIDVGGLVASTLSMANQDFLAGQFRLTSNDGITQRGAVINEGTISAPGGTVALVGPQVENRGVIEAAGGRVGLAAVNSVSVDVEGDGLIFFQADATQASNRLTQLGRIQADGGTVEMRAAARGAFADTVLNLGGTVQARGLASRDGRIVIDGGASGKTVVSGVLDATGAAAGQRGGDIAVQGDQVAVASGAVLDASGAAGGGRVRVGGGFQGGDASLRNANRTDIEGGATLRADAKTNGDGGQVVVWSDGETRYGGSISARGGSQGGNGGNVEVSGKQWLGFGGAVSVSAPAGKSGSLLLDPDSINVTNTGVNSANVTATSSNGTTNVDNGFLSTFDGAITLTASDTVTISQPIANTQTNSSLTIRAGNNVTFDASVSVIGAVDIGPRPATTMTITDASGNGTITIQGSSVTLGGAVTFNQKSLVINATAGNIVLASTATPIHMVNAGHNLTLSSTGGQVQLSGAIANDDAAITVNGATSLQGNTTITSADTVAFNGTIDGARTLSITAPNLTTLAGVIGGSTPLTSLSVANGVQLGGSVTTTGTQSYNTNANGLTIATAGVTLAGSGVTFNGDISKTGSGSLIVSAPATFTGAARNVAVADASFASISGASTDVTIASDATTTIGGASSLKSLSVTTGTGVTLSGTIQTSGAQTYTPDATLGGGTTLQGSAVTFGGNLARGSNALTTITDSITLTGTTTGTGAATFEQSADNRTVGIAGAAGNLALTQAFLDKFGTASSITIGRTGGTAAVNANALSLPTDVVLQSNSGAITLAGVTGNSHALTINSAGTVNLNGAVTGLTTFATDAGGSTNLGASITSSGTQTFGDAVALTASPTLTASAVTFQGAVTGANALTVTATGATTFNNTVSIDALTVTNAATINTTGITTTNAQSYGSANFTAANTTLSGSGVTITGAVTGSSANVTVNSAGTTQFGSTVAVGSLTTDAGGTTRINGNVTANSGAVTIGDALVLDSTATVQASTTASFANTVTPAADNTQGLTVTATGLTTFSGDVGTGVLRLTQLNVTNAAAFGNATTGVNALAQSYGGAVTLGTGATTFTGSTIGMGAGVTGAGNDLTLTAGTTATLGGGFATKSLIVNGAGTASISGAFSTVNNLTLGSAATLTGGTALASTGGTVAINGALTGGNQQLVVTADSLTTAGPAATNLGVVTLQPSSDATTVGVGNGAAGTLALDNTTLGKFGTPTQLVIGRTTSSTLLTVASGFTLPVDTVLRSGSGAMDIGALSGAGHALTINSGGTVSLLGNVSNVSTLTTNATGFTDIYADVTTTGAQVYNDTVRLAGGTSTLTGSTISLTDVDGTLGGTRNLVLFSPGAKTITGTVGAGVALTNFTTTGGGALSLGGNVTTTGTQSYSDTTNLTGSGTITLDGGAITFQPGSSLNLGTANLVIKTAALTAPTAASGTGSLLLEQANAGDAVNINTGVSDFINQTQLNALATFPTVAIGRLDGTGAVTVGPLQLPTNVTIRSNTGSVTLTAPITLRPGDLGHDFTIATTGLISIAAPVSTGTGAQSYGSLVSLASSLTLTGQNIALTSGVTGNGNSLTLADSGTSQLGSAFSGLTGLAVNGAANLASNTSVNSTGSVSFFGTLDGAHSLTANVSGGYIWFRGDVGGTVALQSLSATAGPGNPVFVGSDAGVPPAMGVTTTGAQTYGSAVRLLANTDFTASGGAATLTFTGPVDTWEGRATPIAFGATAGASVRFDANLGTGHSGGVPLASVVVNAPSALFSGTTQINSAGNVDFSGTVNGTAPGVVNLTVNTPGATTFGGAVGNLQALASLNTDAGGTTSLGGNVRTSGFQAYGDAVTLAADATLTSLNGLNIGFGSTLNGAHALTVTTAGTASFGAAVGGSSALTSLSVTNGASVGGNVTTTGAQGYGGAVTVNASTAFTGTDLTFGSSISAGANALTLAGSGATSVAGTINATGITLNNGGTTAFNGATVDAGTGALVVSDNLTLGGAGSVTISAGGNVTASGTVSVPTATALTVNAGGSATFGSTLSGAGSTSLTVNSNGFDLGGAASGIGAVVLRPAPLGTSLALASGAGSITAQALTNLAGVSSLAVTAGGAGHIVAGGAISLPANTTLTSAGGNITLAAVTGNAHSLTVNTTGTGLFGGTVTGVTTLTTDAGGSTQINGAITTSGAQVYNDPVQLGGTVALTGSAVSFNGAINGAQPLTVTATGTTTFGAPVSIGSLTVTNAAALNGGTVSTSGAQSYGGAVTLGAATTVGASAATFSGPVSGAFALTVNASGATSFGSTVNVASLTTDAGGTTTLGGSVTTTGNQVYGDPVTLGTNLTLTASAGGVQFANTLDGAHTLTVTASGTTRFDGAVGGTTPLTSLTVTNGAAINGSGVHTTGAQSYSGVLAVNSTATLDASAITVAGAVTGTGDLTATAAGATNFGSTVSLGSLTTNGGGTTQLGGNVTTTGAQTYTDNVVLGANVVAAAGAGGVTFSGTVNALTEGVQSLTVNTAGTTTFAQGLGNTSRPASLTTDAGGGTVVSADMRTTGGQTYNDLVTMTAPSVFNGQFLTFNAGLNAGAFTLDLQTDNLTLLGPVSGSGTLVLAPSAASTSVGVSGGAGTYQITQATLDGFSGFSTLAVGRVDGTGAINVGNLTMPTNMLLRSNTGTVTLGGTVNSASSGTYGLTVTSGGTTTLAATIGGTRPLSDLTITGNAQVGGATSVTSGTVNFGGTLDLGTSSLALFTSGVTMAGPATAGAGATVRLAPQLASDTLGIAGASGTLQVSQALVDAFGAATTLRLGRTDGTGAVSANALSLPTATVIESGSGTIALNGAINSNGAARDLTVASTGVTSLGANLGGGTALGNTVFSGPVTLASDAAVSAAVATFSGSVDGAHALTVNATTTRFDGAVGGGTALTSLTTDAAGTTRLGASVRTTGAQTYNDDVVLGTNASLSGSTLSFQRKVDALTDGGQALSTSGATAFHGDVGTGARLASLNVNGPAAIDATRIVSTGAQTYAQAVTLQRDTTLAGGSLNFAAAVDGAHALTLQSAGLTTFATNVGATTALTSLTATGGGAVRLQGTSIDTTGAQSYAGALQLSGSTRLGAGSLTLGAGASGASDLQLQVDQLAVTGGLAGTGTLTIAPRDAARTIGVAGGAGGLQIAQNVFSGASGFTQHVVGNANGTGSLQVGALTVTANTKLQSGSGGIDVVGSIDGGFDVTLATGATTRIAGSIGTTTPLRSLTTDNNPTAADWNGTTGERVLFDTAGSRVVTSGAQTYNDPIVTSVPVSMTGSSVVATQAGNRFGGPLSVTATTLQLASDADINLGNVTLANGGQVDTGGTLTLSGALRLNGGTLTLSSTATPTALADFTDPDLQNRGLNFRFAPLNEASAAITQSGTGTVATAVGTTLALRATRGGSISLENAGNTLLGGISAVSGASNEDPTSRFANVTQSGLTVGFVRISSSEINVAGAPTGNGAALGIEADAVKLSADKVTTGPTGQIRGRLPFDNVQGSATSLPALTFVMSPTALSTGGMFGTASADTWLQVQVGDTNGGYLTLRPQGAGALPGAVVLLGGRVEPRPFYDGAGKVSEIRVFYNGEIPRTPQENGALSAVTAVVEDARAARFEEAVRTENVSSRLRSGVIAEVGAGRPATVGRESIRLPENCNVKPGTLRCE